MIHSKSRQPYKTGQHGGNPLNICRTLNSHGPWFCIKSKQIFVRYRTVMFKHPVPNISAAFWNAQL